MNYRVGQRTRVRRSDAGVQRHEANWLPRRDEWRGKRKTTSRDGVRRAETTRDKSCRTHVQNSSILNRKRGTRLATWRVLYVVSVSVIQSPRDQDKGGHPTCRVSEN